MLGAAIGIIGQRVMESATAAEQNEYNEAAAFMNQRFAREMNELNYKQQKEMFDKTAAYMSVGAQKQRLKDAGLNPALATGLTGGTGVTSSGGGTGATMEGNPSRATESLAMGIQLKNAMAQAKLTEAQAEEAKANADKTRKEIPNVEKEGDRITAATNLINAQEINEKEKVKLTQALSEYHQSLTDLNAKKELETMANINVLNAKFHEIVEATEQKRISNEVGRKTMGAMIAQAYETLKNTIADTCLKEAQKIEAESRSDWNEADTERVKEMIPVLQKTVEKIASDIETGKITREKAEAEINAILQRMKLNKQENIRKWIMLPFNMTESASRTVGNVAGILTGGGSKTAPVVQTGAPTSEMWF